MRNLTIPEAKDVICGELAVPGDWVVASIATNMFWPVKAQKVAFITKYGAFAGAGAPVPERPEGGPPSGRPGAILDDTKCNAVWSMTEREGDVVAHKAAPFIVNFEMVDTNKDGKVTEDEFKQGCKNGWVQEQASKAGETGGGQTPDQPTKPNESGSGNTEPMQPEPQ